MYRTAGIQKGTVDLYTRRLNGGKRWGWVTGGGVRYTEGIWVGVLEPRPPSSRPAAEEQAGGERRMFGSGRAPLDEAAPPRLDANQIRVIHT